MKVALIGDVHGNLPALEAVLADAERRGLATVWNVGDFVGYGPFPDEVVKLLRGRPDTVSIAGNYDLKALKFRKKSGKWQKTKRREKWFAFKWAYDNLSNKSRKYLRSLPKEIRLEAEGWRVLLTHGSPESNKEHLGPDTPAERLRELAKTAEADVVLCGHSHQAFKRRVPGAGDGRGGVWFINPGTVGRPDDGDPRASYAVLSITSRRIAAAHHRIAYDVERAAAAVRERGLPEDFARMLLAGRDLDAVAPAL